MNENLQITYKKQIAKDIQKELNYSSIMQVPNLQKIVINMGVGDAIKNSKVIDECIEQLTLITGQKAIVTKAKKSIASFKLREGMSIGAKVTLRGKKMWFFLEKLINITLPRVRDFQGLSPKSYDGFGNYAIGIKEQIIFPEIDYDKIQKIRGMDINIVTTKNDNNSAHVLLTKLGLPFKKQKGKS